MNTHRPDRRDILHQLGDFDAEWYLRQYPDVTMLDMTAEDHFISIGHHIFLGMSATIPSTAERPDVTQVLSRKPTVSYCIPVMDRLDDLRATLETNLVANLKFRDQVEFIVLVLGSDDETADWVQSRFGSYLKSGYLRMIRQPALPIWHFGKAKNLFRPFVAGRFYSSLDGDNYVTAGETEQLLNEINAHGETFIFHHFSGKWGDGSSGRITLPTRIFRQTGYDETFLPRQFDEVDLILSALVAHPGLTLFRYATEHHVLETESVKFFLKAVECAPPVKVLPAPVRHAAQNPHADDYAARDPAASAMQAMNEALSFLKNAPDVQVRSGWVARLRDGAQRWVGAADPDTVMRVLFGDMALPAMSEAVVVCRTSGRWPDATGGTPRVIIDCAETPLPPEAVKENDTILFPQCGDILASDSLWRNGMDKVLKARNVRVLPESSA